MSSSNETRCQRYFPYVSPINNPAISLKLSIKNIQEMLSFSDDRSKSRTKYGRKIMEMQKGFPRQKSPRKMRPQCLFRDRHSSRMTAESSCEFRRACFNRTNELFHRCSPDIRIKRLASGMSLVAKCSRLFASNSARLHWRNESYQVHIFRQSLSPIFRCSTINIKFCGISIHLF